MANVHVESGKDSSLQYNLGEKLKPQEPSLRAIASEAPWYRSIAGRVTANPGKTALFVGLFAAGTALLYYTVQSSKRLHTQLTDELSRHDRRGIDMTI